MIHQLNPSLEVKTPLGDAEAMFIFDYGLQVNSVWCCRMPGGDIKHFYSDQLKIYDNPMNGKGWDIGKEITVNPEYAHHLVPKFEGTIERFPKDPPGKWSIPPDHPDNGGALIGQDKEKWKEIWDDYADTEESFVLFHEFLDKYYQAPKRFTLDTWVKVQNWYRSLVDYKDDPFFDFLVKFYPAPELKK